MKNKVALICFLLFFCYDPNYAAFGLAKCDAKAAFTITVSSPGNGEMFYHGDTIRFACSAYDASGSSTSLDSVGWYSDKDGKIGSGLNFSTPALSEGVHIISVIAAISGAYDSAYVTITIQPDQSVIVYCAGGRFGRGVYWVNGVLHEVPDASELKNIYFHNGDIYLTGAQNSYQACYWKNGIKINLPSRKAGQVNGLFITDNDVYAAGYDVDSVNTFPHPCYWKDSDKYYICSDSCTGSLACIFAQNSDIYAGGTIYSEGNKSYYWKNGTRYLVSDVISEVMSIFVLNGNVTVSGVDQVMVTDMVVLNGWHWQNGQKKFIQLDPNNNDPWDSRLSLRGFYTDGADMYAVCNCYADLGIYIWENGASSKWQDTNGGPTNIFVYNKQLFFCGGSTTDVPHRPIYFRNGKMFNLQNGNDYLIPSSIVVADAQNSSIKRPQSRSPRTWSKPKAGHSLIFHHGSPYRIGVFKNDNLSKRSIVDPIGRSILTQPIDNK